MLNRLKFVVDVKLWRHQDKAIHIDASNSRVETEAIPAFMLVVDCGVNRVARHQGIHHIGQILHGLLV